MQHCRIFNSLVVIMLATWSMIRLGRRALEGATFMAVVMLPVTHAAADDFETCEMQSGDIAITACSRAIASGNYQGNNLTALFSCRGIEYLNKEQFDLAIQDFDQVIRFNPQFATAFYFRGNAYKEKGQYDRAIQDYDELIRLNPQSTDAFNNRGIAYKNKGQYDRAIQDFDQAIRLDPQDAFAIKHRAEAIAKRKQ